MANYMEALGSTTVNIPWEEALPALERGVADCGITSPANANTAHWWQVLNSLMVVPLGGWGIGFFGANLQWWNSLNKDTQAFLEAEFKKVEDRGWEQGGYDLQDGIACNAGKPECKYGIRAAANKAMTVVYPTEKDLALHAQILRDSVLKNWAASCGAQCVEDWNATIGKVVRVETPLPKS
jgi:hypothetical protein